MYMCRYVFMYVYVYIALLYVYIYIHTQQQLSSRDDIRKNTGSDHQLWRFSYAFPIETHLKSLQTIWNPICQHDLTFVWHRMMIHHQNLGVDVGDTREVPSRAVRFRQTITEVEALDMF